MKEGDNVGAGTGSGRLGLARKRAKPGSFSGDPEPPSNTSGELTRGRRDQLGHPGAPSDGFAAGVAGHAGGGGSGGGGGGGGGAIGSHGGGRGGLGRWASFHPALALALRLYVLLVVAVCAIFAVKETYIRSYIFQIQVLERTHAPREECPIVKLTREARGGWNAEPAPSQARVAVSEGAFVGGGSFHAAGGIGEVGNAKGNVTSSPNARKKLRFGILLMCDKGMWPERYTELSILNKKQYAELHGYEVILASSNEIGHSRPAAWSKLLVTQKYLPKYDYLIFLDIDALIMNPAFKLEWVLEIATKQQQRLGGVDGWGTSGQEPDLIMTRDWNGPNSGVILLKNSQFSKWFLQMCWDQEWLIEGPYPFHFEQRAIHFLLQPDSWRQKGLPEFRDYREVRSRTALIDQCAMNSYVIHPWQKLLRRTGKLGVAASYVDGDFILHFAGKKGRVRQRLMEYYNSKAQKALDEYKAVRDGGHAAASSSATRSDKSEGRPKAAVHVRGSHGGI